MKNIFTCLALLMASIASYAQSLLFNGNSKYVHLGTVAYPCHDLLFYVAIFKTLVKHSTNLAFFLGFFVIRF